LPCQFWASGRKWQYFEHIFFFHAHYRAGIVPISEPGYRLVMKADRAYHSDPEILGGTLVFKGTRVPVRSLFDHLKAGDSFEVFLEGFPSVSRSQVLAVLEEMEIEVLTHV
jgi:uncharacterized protein (DUF433 family)